MGYLTRLPGFVLFALRDRRSFAVEVYLALQAIVFGWWLLMPWQSFAVGSDVYTTLSLVPEAVWGTLFLGHGILHLVALETGDRRMRMRGTSMVVFLWLVVLIAFVSAAPWSTATPTYLVPVLAGLWAHNAQCHRWRQR